MPASSLQQLLGKGAVVGETLHDAVVLCGAWYYAEPNLATFTLLSLFRDLERRGFDDKQGVPVARNEPFEKQVVPHLLRISNILSVTPAADVTSEAESLVVAYRDSIKATP